MKLVTNLSLFSKNYKELLKPKSILVDSYYKDNLRYLKVVKCIKEFKFDQAQFVEGNYYLMIKRISKFTLYEITGLWENFGHSGNLLTFKALDEGLKGWHVDKRYFKNLQEVPNFFYHNFLYGGGINGN